MLTLVLSLWSKLYFRQSVILLSHYVGCGDYQVADVSHLPDPCPLPALTKRRSKNEVESKIYAPFSGVGGVVYDKDAVYIDMVDNQSNKQQTQQQVKQQSH